jgi:hypothetical protein
MLAGAPGSEIVRIIIIIVFAAVTLFLRATKKPTPSRPAPGAGAPRTTPLDSIREAMRQASEQQARARQRQDPFQSSTLAPPPVSESLKLDSFNQPPSIKPESPIVPSLLLLALFACLCYMAYRYFAG